jgi:GT2 family glycosyltransferase
MNPGGYNLFIMTRRVFDVVGMFDENMYPAFFEDADMDRRVELCKRMPNQR